MIWRPPGPPKSSLTDVKPKRRNEEVGVRHLSETKKGGIVVKQASSTFTVGDKTAAHDYIKGVWCFFRERKYALWCLKTLVS